MADSDVVRRFRGAALPSVQANQVFLFLIIAVLPAYGMIAGDEYLLSLSARVAITAIAALGLDLLITQAGLISLGHAGFVGVGAYALGIASGQGITSGLLLYPVAITAGAGAALLIGAVSLRTSGVYFIMITLAFGQMLFFIATGLSHWGGDDGFTLWQRATLGPVDLKSEPRVLPLCLMLSRRKLVAVSSLCPLPRSDRWCAARRTTSCESAASVTMCSATASSPSSSAAPWRRSPAPCSPPRPSS